MGRKSKRIVDSFVLENLIERRMLTILSLIKWYARKFLIGEGKENQIFV